MKILALDPGKTTGWAALKEGRLAGGSFPMWSGIENLLTKFCPDVVVVESFRLYPWKAKGLSFNEFEPVQVIGVIMFLTEKLGVKMVTQQAQERVVIKLRRIKGFNAHSASAAQHAILYATRNDLGDLYSHLRDKRQSNKVAERLRKSLEKS